MQEKKIQVLTINCGSSSIKFSLYQYDKNLLLQLSGKLEKIGTGDTRFEYQEKGSSPVKKALAVKDMPAAAVFFSNWFEKNTGFEHIECIGHRIVHGMKHTSPQVINQEILDEFKQITVFDPDHMPGAIAMIEEIREKYPHLQQVACFDTAFHAGLPRVANMFAIPRRFEKDGIRRYGFHGLSYQYLLDKLVVATGEKILKERVVLAHLGSGSSMAAVKNGKCIDTTMGFTPTGGFMMGTRSGDIDPGIISYLLRKYKYTANELDSIMNHESGLLGVSATSSDMQELLNKEPTDTHAAEAIALFCYQAKKNLCALTGILGGIDTLVFTGGIGENAAAVRLRICEGLKHLGIELDAVKNRKNAKIISRPRQPVKIYIIPANEEYMIARLTIALQDH